MTASPEQRESPEWEAAYRKARRNTELRKRRLGWLEIPREERIVEFGCGDGLNLQCLRDMGYTRLAGFDISPDLLAGLDFPVAVADGSRLAFRTDSIDVLLVDSVLHHLHPLETQLRPALEEIFRVLRPGGRFVFLEPRACWLRSVLDWFSWSRLAWLVPPLENRGDNLKEELYCYLPWLDFDASGGVERLVRATGFEVERWTRSAIGMAVVCRKPEP